MFVCYYRYIVNLTDQVSRHEIDGHKNGGQI